MSQKRTEKKNYNLLAISILSAIGILLSLYLTYVDVGGGHAAFCTAGTDCDVVRQSAFAKMLGIPVAAYGVAAYGAILAVSLLSMARKKRWLILFVLS
ncbi:MAG: vitamin K epoxide reductase family protein, partial [Candidatus Dadabacteria bacterium]